MKTKIDIVLKSGLTRDA